MSQDPQTGRRIVTIEDVARQAGVAISSVSTALNGRRGVSEATREHIRAVARELGYVPSLRGRSLSAKRAFAVGLVVRRDPTVLGSDPFFGAFLAGIESVLSQRGYALVLHLSGNAEEDLARHRRLAADHRVDGVFINELTHDDPRLALVRELGLPAVAISETEVDCPALVLQDNSPPIRDLVERFLALGHRRFAHVSGPSTYLHATGRRDVWQQTLAHRGFPDQEVIESDFTYAGGAKAAEQVFRRPEQERPTAVFCANDLMAAGFLTRACDLGIPVPGAISIAGFDGTDLGTYLRPTLTTITTSPDALGSTATSLLLDAIDGGPLPTLVKTRHPALVVRDSIGPAPHLSGA
ncbi:MAG TPA: LacI family DNA-binding transcriptional regulator [Actinocrinis sp.]